MDLLGQQNHCDVFLRFANWLVQDACRGRPRMQGWNDRVRPILDVARSIGARRLELPSDALIDVAAAQRRAAWILAHAAMEVSLHGGVIESFFSRASELLRRGLLPVGWDGPVEFGRFAVVVADARAGDGVGQTAVSVPTPSSGVEPNDLLRPLEPFWDQFREAGDRFGERPTFDEYEDALAKVLAARMPETESRDLVAKGRLARRRVAPDDACVLDVPEVMRPGVQAPARFIEDPIDETEHSVDPAIAAYTELVAEWRVVDADRARMAKPRGPISVRIILVPERADIIGDASVESELSAEDAKLWAMAQIIVRADSQDPGDISFAELLQRQLDTGGVIRVLYPGTALPPATRMVVALLDA